MRTSPQVFRLLHETYDFQYLLISDDYLTWQLSSRDWRLVYWDRTGARTFIKNSPANHEYIQNNQYRFYTNGLSESNLSDTLSDSVTIAVLRKEISRHYQTTGEKPDLLLLAVLKQINTR